MVNGDAEAGFEGRKGWGEVDGGDHGPCSTGIMGSGSYVTEDGYRPGGMGELGSVWVICLESAEKMNSAAARSDSGESGV